MKQNIIFTIHHITNFPNSFLNNLSLISLDISIHGVNQKIPLLHPTKILTSEASNLNLESSDVPETKENKILFSHDKIVFNNIDIDQFYKLKIELEDENEEKWSTCKLDLRKIVKEGEQKKTMRMNIPMSGIQGIKPTISMTYINSSEDTEIFNEIQQLVDQKLENVEKINSQEPQIVLNPTASESNASSNDTFVSPSLPSKQIDKSPILIQKEPLTQKEQKKLPSLKESRSDNNSLNKLKKDTSKQKRHESKNIKNNIDDQLENEALGDDIKRELDLIMRELKTDFPESISEESESEESNKQQEFDKFDKKSILSPIKPKAIIVKSPTSSPKSSPKFNPSQSKFSPKSTGLLSKGNHLTPDSPSKSVRPLSAKSAKGSKEINQKQKDIYRSKTPEHLQHLNNENDSTKSKKLNSKSNLSIQKRSSSASPSVKEISDKLRIQQNIRDKALNTIQNENNMQSSKATQELEIDNEFKTSNQVQDAFVKEDLRQENYENFDKIQNDSHSEIDYSRELNFSGILREFDRIGSPERNTNVFNNEEDNLLHTNQSPQPQIQPTGKSNQSYQNHSSFSENSNHDIDKFEDIDLMEQLTQKDIEIDDLKQEINELKKKLRIIQQNSNFSELFQLYESDIYKLFEENQALLKENQEVINKYQRNLVSKNQTDESLSFYVYSHYKNLKLENQQMKTKIYRAHQTNPTNLSNSSNPSNHTTQSNQSTHQGNISSISQNTNDTVFREGSGAVLRRKVQQLNEQIESYKIDIEQKNVEITKLKLKIRRYAQNLNQQQQHSNVNSNLNPRLSKENLLNMNDQIQHLTNKLESTTQENDILRKDLIDSRKKLLELTEQYETLQKNTEKIVEINEQLEQDKKQQRSKLKTMNEKLTTNTNLVEELRELRRPEALIQLSQHRPVILPGERREVNALFSKMARFLDQDPPSMKVLEQLRESFLNLEHECLDSRASELSYIELLMDYKEQLHLQGTRKVSPQRKSMGRSRSISNIPRNSIK